MAVRHDLPAEAFPFIIEFFDARDPSRTPVRTIRVEEGEARSLAHVQIPGYEELGIPQGCVGVITRAATGETETILP